MVNMSSTGQALLFVVWHGTVGRDNCIKLKCWVKLIFSLALAYAQPQGTHLEYPDMLQSSSVSLLCWVDRSYQWFLSKFWWKESATYPRVCTVVCYQKRVMITFFLSTKIFFVFFWGGGSISVIFLQHYYY